MRIYIILIIITFISLNVIAQTGPAGVGSSTNNILWTKSEDLSALANGDEITTWPDMSGNSNDLTQSDALFKPEYVTNVQNGFPAVRFNQVNSRLIKNSFSNFPTSGISVFLVNKSDNESSDGILSYATTSHNNEFLLYNSSNLSVYASDVHVSTSQNISNNNWHIIDVSWTSAGGNTETWKDNNFEYSGTISNGTNIVSGGCLALAAEQDAVDGGYVDYQDHTGDFLEAIIYNIELNSAQRIIVGNYLAAKYNLTISNDYYSYQASYSHDLAGIGRFDASNIHSVAQSSKLITIGNASAMTTNGEYLLFAHDNASISTWSTTEQAYENTQRIAREWRIDETGNVGTIDFTLNEDDLAALPSGFTKYALMVDSDGDFTNDAKIYEMSVFGSDYKVTGVDIADGDYISIAAVKPTIQFSPNTGNDLESSNATADIELNYIPASAVSIAYSTTNGTALAGSDFTAIGVTTLTFNAGIQTQSVAVNVIDDVSSENLEIFTINLSNPSAGLIIGTEGVYTHSIEDNDNDRKIFFSAASSSGNESIVSVTITVKINIPDGSNSTTVDYAVSGGTASGGGTDYTLAAGTATIIANNTTTTFSVTVNNDDIDEINETIKIKLSNSSNANLSIAEPIEYTYTIIDNDDAPTIYFTNTTSSGLESVSSKNIEVKLSSVSAKDISVSFIKSGTATINGDYNINTSSPISISAGSTTTNVSLSVIDDDSEEIEETVILTLNGPTNATLGANTQYTYTISDDDNAGFSGPGGVGESSNIKLWVRAEDIQGTNDGDDISLWADHSGNGNNLTQSNATFKPHFYKNVINGYQVVRCNIDNSRLIKNSFTDFPKSEITTFCTSKPTAFSDNASFSYATSTNNNEYLIISSNNIRLYRGGASSASGISTNTWGIVSTSWRNSDDKATVSLNGKDNYSGIIANSDITSGGCLAIGAEQDGVNTGYVNSQDFEGDYSEVIVYNIILNSAQKNIVNNYLSAKYKIEISAKDKYINTSDDYFKEVIGVGTESDGSQRESHGSGGLWLKQATNFGNGDYLFIGHNQVNSQLYTPAEDAGLSAIGIEQRWGRDWYFDITDAGSAITTDLTFDFVEAGMGSPTAPDGTTSNYKLLYRSGTSGNWKIVGSATSKNPTQVIFSNQSLPDVDGYYTLGTINASNSPLPVELITFEANAQNNKVLLNWRTATELNNDYFEIQHSIDNTNWKVLGNMAGNGTTNIVHDYSYTHQKPNNGINYYRLKQIDFDGKFSFSNIVTANIANSDDIKIFPNPTNGLVNIINIGTGSRVELIDMNSRIVSTEIKYVNNSAVLNLEPLSSSIYYIRVISENDVKVFKVIKN